MRSKQLSFFNLMYMKRSILLLIIIFLTVRLSGQQAPDTLQMLQTHANVKFFRSGKPLTNTELMSTLKGYMPAYAEMKKARSNKAGVILGFTGGFLVGWTLGTLVTGGKPQWYMTGIGAGLIGLSIPFDKAFRRHARRSVELFNASLR